MWTTPHPVHAYVTQAGRTNGTGWPPRPLPHASRPRSSQNSSLRGSLSSCLGGILHPLPGTHTALLLPPSNSQHHVACSFAPAPGSQSQVGMSESVLPVWDSQKPVHCLTDELWLQPSCQVSGQTRAQGLLGLGARPRPPMWGLLWAVDADEGRALGPPLVQLVIAASVPCRHGRSLEHWSLFFPLSSLLVPPV